MISETRSPRSDRTVIDQASCGPLVSGTTLALIMAMTGRLDHCDELDGDGVAILRRRSTAAAL